MRERDNAGQPANNGEVSRRQLAAALVGALGASSLLACGPQGEEEAPIDPDTISAAAAALALDGQAIVLADNSVGSGWGEKVQAALTTLGSRKGQVWVTSLAGMSTPPTSNIVLQEGQTLRFLDGGDFEMGTARIRVSDYSAIIGPGSGTLTLRFRFDEPHGQAIAPDATDGEKTLGVRISGIHVTSMTLKNGMLLKGSSNHAYGIYVHNATRWILDDVRVSYFDGAPSAKGINIWATATGNAYNTFHHVSIEDCYYGLYSDATASGADFFSCNDNVFTHLIVDHATYGIYLMRGNENTFVGPRIVSNTTGSQELLFVNNTGHYFFGLTMEQGNAVYGVHLGAAASGNVIFVKSAASIVDEAPGKNIIIIPGSPVPGSSGLIIGREGETGASLVLNSGTTSGTLPASPSGFLKVNINGIVQRIPYYDDVS